MNGEEFRAVYASMWTYDMAMCPVVWCYPSLGTVVTIQTWLELDSSGPAPALSYALIYCCRCTKWWETMNMILLTIVMVFSCELSLVQLWVVFSSELFLLRFFGSFFCWFFWSNFSKISQKFIEITKSLRNLLKSQAFVFVLGNKLVHLRLEILRFWDFSGC